MKMTVLYHSKTGNTREMAAEIASGMELADGVEARCFSIDAIDPDWLSESHCVVLGSPTYMASVSAAVKTFLEGAGRLGLAGKLGGAFATADYIHGGGDLGIRLILDHMLVFGMLTYSGGGSRGKPVIHLGPVAIKGRLDESREVFQIYGQRMAEKALELFG